MAAKVSLNEITVINISSTRDQRENVQLSDFLVAKTITVIYSECQK